MNPINLILIGLIGSSRFDFHVQGFATFPSLSRQPITRSKGPTFLRASTDNADDEIERLRSMAAKLRAEAASLEVRSAY